MKLKPVVASVVMLGLMAPAFAKSSMASRQAVLDQNSVISPACSKGWFNRIMVSGKGSVVGALGSHSPVGMFQVNNSSTDLYVNDFTVILDAQLSAWSKATLNLTYFGAPSPFHKIHEHDSYDMGVGNRRINHSIVADEAYVTIGNMARNPFYFVAGKKYVPFGDYVDPHVPYGIMSPTQMLSQTNAPTAILGVSSDFGMYASIFALSGDTGPTGNESVAINIRNFGAKLGYYDNLSQFKSPRTHVNFAISYMNNLWDTQVFSPVLDPRHESFSVIGTGATTPYQKVNHPANYRNQIEPVGGVSLHGDLAYKDFSVFANYVTAISDMLDDKSVFVVDPKQNRSRFWAADVGADYSFKTWSKNSSLGLGVQFTGNGAWMADENTYGTTDWARIVPRWRLLAEYKINLLKNTDLILTATHGKSYDFDVTANAAANTAATAGPTTNLPGIADPTLQDGPNKTVSAGYARLCVKF